MPSINLAPGTEYIIAARKRRVRLYAISVVILVIIFFGYGVLSVYNGSLAKTNDQVKADIGAADAELHKLNDTVVRVQLFEKRLTQVKTLLDSHIKWDMLLADLERLLPIDTTITSFRAGSSDSIIAVEGVTASVDGVAQAIASLSSSPSHASVFKNGTLKNVSRVDQDAATGAQVRYLFSITVEFDPTALHNQITQ